MALASTPIPRPHPDILDLRHFSGREMRSLLLDEAERWQRRLHWDYRESTKLLLDYLGSHSLSGYVAVDGRRVLGYTFGVLEANKAVVGDLYAFGESEALANPVCDFLLTHLLETLQATPGIDRIESQLLMFPAGALAGPFSASGFSRVSRLFMLRELSHARPSVPNSLPPGFALHAWQPAVYNEAAELIHHAYTGHVDSGVNDQYRTVAGAARFLHNIVRFPGCGLFDPTQSFLLRDKVSGALAGVLLCSRVRHDVGHITQLCIAPAHRGKGLGRFLLRHCADSLTALDMHAISLTVTEENTGALHLYLSQGFHALHRFEAMVWEKGSE